MKKWVLVLLCLSFITAGFAGKDARLLRFPDIHDDLIAFVYAGDIWTVPATGGQARRLTSHQGFELMPKISPDGKWIAFSGEYSGSRQVYVMPATGGEPRQLTYYNEVGELPPRGGYDNLVLGWTPDSRHILFRANRTPWAERKGKLFLVNIDGGLETPLPMPEAGFGAFSPDGKAVCFTQISREFRTWKRYQGGMAADLWIYDLEKNTSRRITDFPGTDHMPRWYKDKIYFASDRDLLLNMYEYDLKTGNTRQLTHHQEYDVMFPSGEGGRLAYENGGYIYKLDLQTGTAEKVTVDIAFDNPGVRPYYKNVGKDILSGDLSPSGKRAAFEARGDIFTVPAKEGITQNLTDSQGIREIYPRWSPDGKYLVYYSDRTGEYEIYLQDKDGKEKPRPLTENSHGWRYAPVWSKDSQKLLFADTNRTLQVLDIGSRQLTEVDRSEREEFFGFHWSPDSNWIVYSRVKENNQAALWVYSVKEKKKYPLTESEFNDYSPVFSNCGKYILFLSDRDFNLDFSSFEFDYLYNKSTRIYAMALTKDTPPLFKPKNDREEDKEPAPAPPGKGAKEAAKDMVQIDVTGADERVVALPNIRPGNYGNLVPLDGAILYATEDGVFRYNFDKQESESIIKGVGRTAVSSDGKKLLYTAGDQYGIIDIAPNQKVGDGQLKLDNLVMQIDPPKEWQQMYTDGWRIFRDWFYVHNMHGVNWPEMKKKYEVLLPYVSHRLDLDYILGELVGEMNVGHAYVDRGDFARVERIDTGLLGAELTADSGAGRYIISKIYKGENWNKDRRSPLTEQGIVIKEGDYLISLNGHDVTIKDNPYRFLENTVDKLIPITVNSKPDLKGTRTYTIKPIKSELELFYLDWVESRRQMVDRLSGGRIGYIHVPDTAGDGNRELFRGMYAYYNKEALIIDDRYNQGGMIPNIMTDLLGRINYGYAASRGSIEAIPQIAHQGPKAMLINYYAGSGGDAFPYFFKKMNLGPLIGTRTWGGLVGLSGNPPLVDGGLVNVPTFGFFDAAGQWIIEGIGMPPDIEVIDEPHRVARGEDPAIEKAVEVLLKELEKNPPKKVNAPADPDRSKWIEKRK